MEREAGNLAKVVMNTCGPSQSFRGFMVSPARGYTMRKIFFYSVSLFLLTTSLPVCGQVRLPKLVSDGMVLQRNTDVRLWGWAKPGQEVTIRFLGRTYNTSTKSDGDWAVMLSPMNPGGPYSMEIDASPSGGIPGNHIVLKNIMIGDVWLCSGQSNMVIPMERVKPMYREFIAHAYNDDIRMFMVPDVYNFNTPQKDLQYGQWLPENPWTILNFSAASLFFATNLYAKYHVPIGLIEAAVGGTPIQAWLSAASLKEFPAAQKLAEDYKQAGYRDSVADYNNTTDAAWYGKINREDKGLNADVPWYSPSYNDSSWQTMEVPNFYDVTPLKQTHGVIWFRRSFNVPAALVQKRSRHTNNSDGTGKRAKLLMGRIVNADYDYVNGVLVGAITYQYPPRRYDVAAGILKPGRNSITVRLINTRGEGGFIKDKPYELKIGSHVIDLKGKWHYRLGVAIDSLVYPTFLAFQPEGLFNGMIAPLLNYTIKGTIWYQGESNTGDPSGYAAMFKSMITDWRAKWGEGNFPFVFVQLPNYGDPAIEPPAWSGWADVRQAQLEALSLPNTGMAVTIDIGAWNDIHPLDKGDVGKRLALAAEHVAYGDNSIVYSSPLYKSAKIEGNKVVVYFTDTGTGLVSKVGPLKWFEIAGRNGKYVFADAKISGNKVIVWSPKVPNPEMVRYAWADDPMGANLYNNEGLPASPFETGVIH